jgi:hypothetical protein
MDGFGFLNAVSQMEGLNLQKTKIYLLSASSDLNDIVKVAQHRACAGFISKPLTRESVRKIVNESAVVGVNSYK